MGVCQFNEPMNDSGNSTWIFSNSSKRSVPHDPHVIKPWAVLLYGKLRRLSFCTNDFITSFKWVFHFSLLSNSTPRGLYFLTCLMQWFPDLIICNVPIKLLRLCIIYSVFPGCGVNNYYRASFVTLMELYLVLSKLNRGLAQLHAGWCMSSAWINMPFMVFTK